MTNSFFTTTTAAAELGVTPGRVRAIDHCRAPKDNSGRTRLAHSNESTCSRPRPQTGPSGYFTNAIDQALKKVSIFVPNLSMLPPPLLKLWPELGATTETFTIYGITALALRVGHRTSVDFDFFSNAPFAPEPLATLLPYLKDAEHPGCAGHPHVSLGSRRSGFQCRFTNRCISPITPILAVHLPESLPFASQFIPRSLI